MSVDKHYVNMVFCVQINTASYRDIVETYKNKKLANAVSPSGWLFCFDKDHQRMKHVGEDKISFCLYSNCLFIDIFFTYIWIFTHTDAHTRVFMFPFSSNGFFSWILFYWWLFFLRFFFFFSLVTCQALCWFYQYLGSFTAIYYLYETEK